MIDIPKLTATLDGTKSFRDLDPATQEQLAELRPNGPYSQEQAELLGQYCLKIPADFDLERFNAAGDFKIGGRQAEDGLYAPATLLTAIRAGEPYYWAAPSLASWLIVPKVGIRFVEDDPP